ncbi:MAG TPA: DUF4424 family protein [Candidatus Methylomirabilis sp.]|nr:DUF4424 family protein [Candidatus Methylomirabilis sp.]
MVTLGAGGLIPVNSSVIAMESEDLQVSIHEITVRYIFRNPTDRDVDAIVAFPLPPVDGAEVQNEPMALPSKDPVNYMSFKVTVDGQIVKPSVEVRAFKNGKDVTARLRSLGLPPSVLDPKTVSAIEKLLPEQRDRLQKDELIVDQPQYIFHGKRIPREVWPWWETHIQFYWTQRFPPKSTTQIVHTYKPVVGGSYIVRGDDGESSVQPYCGGPDALNQIAQMNARLPAKDRIILWEKRIQYILTTGNNWNGPIGHFHLTVTIDRSEDILATCFPDLERTSTTRYEFTRSQFRPDQELNLLILQTNK